MSSTTEGSPPWQQPPIHQIRSWKDAEANAATWMRHWGYADAAVTNSGPDGGVDVRSERAIAQVKYLAAAVGRPDLQRLGGVGAGEPGKRLFFFSGSDYTSTAADYANATGMALFTYSLDGSVEPANAVAREVARVPSERQPSYSKSALHPDTTVSASTIKEPADWKERWRAGGWYLGVPILSAGVFAAIPFWHAHSKLNRPELRSRAIAYTVAGTVIMAVFGITPKDSRGEPTGALGHVLETIGVIGALIVIISACVSLVPLRRELFRRPSWEVPAVDTRNDEAVAARGRRTRARSLWDQDRAEARGLAIGRPDLNRGYDDGGLVDVNTAPADVIASVCGLSPEVAGLIVSARARRGSYYALGEILLDVPLPRSVEGELRERLLF